MKSLLNKKGFTLTEVLLGIAILTVAIVLASNLLLGLINTNRLNVSTLQAHYLAVEGLEAVRNIRDTNWLHNRHWLSKDSKELWGIDFDPQSNGIYSVGLEFGAFNVGITNLSTANSVGDLALARPWKVILNGDGKIYKNNYGQDFYFSADGQNSLNAGFKRTIIVKPYDCKNSVCLAGYEDQYVLVQSKVEYEVAGFEKEIVLSEVMTNWKGGAL